MIIDGRGGALWSEAAYDRQHKRSVDVDSSSTPAGVRKSTFILSPKRGGGVKVLLRYFLTRK